MLSLIFPGNLLFWTLQCFMHKRMRGINNGLRDKEFSSTWQKGFSFAKYQFPFKAIKVKFVFLPHEKMSILITVEKWSIHTFKKRLLPFRMILHMKLKMKSTVKPQGHWHFKDMSIDVNCQCFCYGEALYFKYAEVSFYKMKNTDLPI